jgi:predicted Fe-Mo cluster-binding NifX family protein
MKYPAPETNHIKRRNLMRIAISMEEGGGLDAPVSQHFGHAPYFALVDVEGTQVMSVQTVANPFASQHTPGAIPQFVQSQRADVILTGGMGHRAVTFFEGYGIRPVTGAAGTGRQALASFLGGELTGAGPCHDGTSHAGGHDCH